MDSSHSVYKTVDSSWSNVIAITIPIVLTMLSHHLLFVIDRVMLLHYSIDAMNAVAASSMFCAVLICFFNGLAGTAEIFVGQFNGSKQYQMLPQPSWQMFYFALLSILFFIPVGYWSRHINLLPECYLQAGVNYQKIVLYGGPLAVVQMALASFFIGQGRSLLVTISVIAGAVGNVVLDYLLIYGVAGMWPAYGEKGAALATVLSSLISAVILAIIFFSPSNRERFGTAKPRWLISLSKSIIRVGLPVAFNETVALLSWFLMVSMINHTTKELTTIYTLGINIYMLMIFVGDGLYKASAAINSNLIGQSNLNGVYVAVKRLMVVATAAVLLLAVILIAGSQSILSFCNRELLSLVESNRQGIITSLILVVVGVQTESMMAVLWGVLVAGGDTYFAAISYQICLWVGTVLPVAVLFFTGRLCRIEQPFFFSVCWSAGTLICYLLRYRSLKWYRKIV